MTRHESPPWAVRVPKPTGLQAIDRTLREKLLARAGGRDEVTGERLQGIPELHHRRKRSQGRDDSPCNLLVVSGLTHRRIGSWERWARDRGFVLSFGEDPATTALLLHLRRWVLLSPGFTYVDAERGPDSGDAA